MIQFSYESKPPGFWKSLKNLFKRKQITFPAIVRTFNISEQNIETTKSPNLPDNCQFVRRDGKTIVVHQGKVIGILNE